MDPLLRGKSLRFFVDEIFPFGDDRFRPSVNNLLFSARIIPDIKSKNLPPFFTRTINITADLLENSFYESMRSKLATNQDFRKDFDCRGSVVQGGYYEISVENVPPHVFNPRTIISGPELGELMKREIEGFEVIEDIFRGNIEDSPYKRDYKNLNKEILSPETGAQLLSKHSSFDKLDAMYLFCFNVGQGDSFLLLLPNGSTYLIDLNFVTNGNWNPQYYVCQIKHILHNFGLPQGHLKALVITHKHLDHIRGINAVTENFTVDYLLINMDYEHETNAVANLMEAATSIKQWVNVNDKMSIIEGACKLDITNPTHETRTKDKAPDINDSSIVMCVTYKNGRIYLTGDAGYPVLQSRLNANNHNNAILKVSHHGSITGTSDILLSKLAPTYAFISAGNSKRYRHPHQETLDCLKAQSSIHQVTISKHVKGTTCYKITGTRIYCQPLQNFSLGGCTRVYLNLFPELASQAPGW
ncbi:MAG: MBL fold metallo-hydrolase [Syntrophothermus sp.]|uniref:ComEC/Rec2 family competence protein n=1 Tax=Syntrophothermus sp. TaxID=2736299 RepID=UPI00257B9E15|nr:MBL fold metallo-hydrolase [Syntrophothermus sp.]NSW83212.1 MBL fold metallo-hydrolase [Syntrophothermus sp.]